MQGTLSKVNKTPENFLESLDTGLFFNPGIRDWKTDLGINSEISSGLETKYKFIQFSQ